MRNNQPTRPPPAYPSNIKGQSVYPTWILSSASLNTSTSVKNNNNFSTRPVIFKYDMRYLKYTASIWLLFHPRTKHLKIDRVRPSNFRLPLKPKTDRISFNIFLNAFTVSTRLTGTWKKRRPHRTRLITTLFQRFQMTVTIQKNIIFKYKTTSSGPLEYWPLLIV